MNKIAFEWDDEKNFKNQKKHGVSFEEAQSVFFDDYAVQYWNEEHSDQEERFLMLGMSSQMRILRIISARKATNNESKEYVGGKS